MVPNICSRGLKLAPHNLRPLLGMKSTLSDEFIFNEVTKLWLYDQNIITELLLRFTFSFILRESDFTKKNSRFSTILTLCHDAIKAQLFANREWRNTHVIVRCCLEAERLDQSGRSVAGVPKRFCA